MWLVDLLVFRSVIFIISCLHLLARIMKMLFFVTDVAMSYLLCLSDA